MWVDGQVWVHGHNCVIAQKCTHALENFKINSMGMIPMGDNTRRFLMRNLPTASSLARNTGRIGKKGEKRPS